MISLHKRIVKKIRNACFVAVINLVLTAERFKETRDNSESTVHVFVLKHLQQYKNDARQRLSAARPAMPLAHC